MLLIGVESIRQRVGSTFNMPRIQRGTLKIKMMRYCLHYSGEHNEVGKQLSPQALGQVAYSSVFIIYWQT